MVLFCSDFEEFRSFLGKAQPQNRVCLSEVRASFAILAEQALEKQEIILRNGKTRPFTNLIKVHTLNSYAGFSHFRV